MKTNLFVTAATSALCAMIPLYITIGGVLVQSSQNTSGVQEAWVKRVAYFQDLPDEATDIAVDSSGNVYVTGKVSAAGNDYNYGTIKYDRHGNIVWGPIIESGHQAGADEPAAIALDDAYVYVTGKMIGPDGEYNFGTIKYNRHDGSKIWRRLENGDASISDPEDPDTWPSHNEAVAIAVDASGNVYVAGDSFSYARDWSYMLIKYDSEGNRQWSALTDGPVIQSDDRVHAMAIDATGNVYVTGVYREAQSMTIKYNGNDGQVIWKKFYKHLIGGGQPLALALDQAGHVYVTGADDGGDDDGYITIKYDAANGNELKTSQYYGPNDDHGAPTALAVDGWGNIYVTGGIESNTNDGYDYLTIKYNAELDEVWTRRYNSPANGWAMATDLALDAAGNVYVTGRSSGQQGGWDYATIKYDPQGTEVWAIRYEGPGDDIPIAIAVDKDGEVYVTGYSEKTPGGDKDYLTIKYKQIPIANAGPDKTICAGGSVQIGGNPTGSGGKGGPYTFSWSPVTGLDNPTAPNPIASPATTTTYTVTVTETATGGFATDDVTVTIPATGWSVAHIVDVDDVVQNLDQSAAPRYNRSLALSPDERYLYLGYTIRVRKIDLTVSDPANNHSAVVAQLKLPQGTQPPRDIATDDKGRVYLALGTKIEIYNSNLQAPPLHTISGFTACEGVAVRREINGALAVYATDRLDKTLERFVLVAGDGETITSSIKRGLDGDGEVRIIGASRPRGLDIGGNGTAWIADPGKNKVYRVTAAGRTIDSTSVKSPMDVAFDASRGEVYVSQYTLRTIKVLNLSGKIRRTLTPPAADLNIDLAGETGMGALCGIDVASCKRVYVANEQGRSLLTPQSGDSPFSNVGDNNNVKAADTDPVLLVTGNVLSKQPGEEESEVTSNQQPVTSYELAQNYPNPFNPSTTIRFALPEAAEVSLKIYDIAGQLVQTLVGGVIEAGRHQVVWDGTNQHGVLVASGIYFYQLRAGAFKQVRKMSLVR